MSSKKDDPTFINYKYPSLPDDVVLRVDNVSKKFCRNLKRSMWYGMKDLAANMVGLRNSGEKKFKAQGRNLRAERESLSHEEGTEDMKFHFQSSPLILQPSKNLRPSEFWAIKNISFELKRGECLGLIGQNGCGKSTLLRLIAGIFPPDQGAIAIRGRIGALIALGAGFHPHLTGRENIFLNGAILGLSKAEIKRKFDGIVDFSEIGDFLDAPVSTYSSGMKVRLGFAVATSVSPDLLIVDEVLSVGDTKFRRKCLDRMTTLLDGGKGATIFVSHDLRMVEQVSNRVMLVDKGAVLMHDKAQRVIAFYLDLQFRMQKEDIAMSRSGSGEVRYTDAHANCNLCQDAEGVDVVIKAKFKCNKSRQKLRFRVGIIDVQTESTITLATSDQKNIDSDGCLICTFKNIQLRARLYSVYLSITDLLLQVDQWHNATTFMVKMADSETDGFSVGDADIIKLPHEFLFSMKDIEETRML